MNSRPGSCSLLISMLLVAAAPAFAANDALGLHPSAAAVGPLAMFWLCYGSREKAIGGWLLYLYIQIYLAVAFLLFGFGYSVIYASAATFSSAGSIWYMLKLTLPLTVTASEAVIMTMMLKNRQWWLVNILRVLLAADLLVSFLVLLTDPTHNLWDSPLNLLSLAFPAILLLYFSCSKRVRKIFQTHDWQPFPGSAALVAQRSLRTSSATPRSNEQSFDLRFYLTEQEFTEAAASRNVLGNNRFFRLFGRAWLGLVAIGALLFPYITGKSWLELVVNAPSDAMLSFAGVLLGFWGLAGFPGTSVLNRLVNQLNSERHLVLTDSSVTITHGKHKSTNQWQRFRSFSETANVFVLQTNGMEFCTIPKRTLPMSDVQGFRLFLANRLPEKFAIRSQ